MSGKVDGSRRALCCMVYARNGAFAAGEEGLALGSTAGSRPTEEKSSPGTSKSCRWRRDEGCGRGDDVGRPRKYTERTLKRAVEEYFDSITREVGLTEKVDTGKKDADGHKVFENVPVINKRGEQVKITEYLVPQPWAPVRGPQVVRRAAGGPGICGACHRPLGCPPADPGGARTGLCVQATVHGDVGRR